MTYDLMERTRRHYGIEIQVIFPDSRQVEQMVQTHGVNLFHNNVELRKLCCQIRKIEPLKRALAGLDAWVCGLRAEQSVTRSTQERIEWDSQFGLIKVSPLADWRADQVWDYVREQGVPYNALHDRGYPSIGCAPCTRAVGTGEDARAGRWWWEQPEHKECGLHLRPEDARAGREEVV